MKLVIAAILCTFALAERNLEWSKILGPRKERITRPCMSFDNPDCRGHVWACPEGSYVSKIDMKYYGEQDTAGAAECVSYDEKSVVGSIAFGAFSQDDPEASVVRPDRNNGGYGAWGCDNKDGFSAAEVHTRQVHDYYGDDNVDWKFDGLTCHQHDPKEKNESFGHADNFWIDFGPNCKIIGFQTSNHDQRSLGLIFECR